MLRPWTECLCFNCFAPDRLIALGTLESTRTWFAGNVCRPDKSNTEGIYCMHAAQCASHRTDCAALTAAVMEINIPQSEAAEFVQELSIA
ncbi:hypothetical protein MHYP_G00174100 [Metynnis hypsauchen]